MINETNTILDLNKDELKKNIVQVVSEQRMLKGLITYLKIEDLILDVIPDLFVHLLSSDEGRNILNRLDKNGKITELIRNHSKQ